MTSTTMLIVGSGMGGLATALAVQDGEGRDGDRGERFELTLIERDPAPASADSAAAFDDWRRPGVPQFRHSHMLLSRLRTIIRDRHPRLLARLQAAGIESSSLDEMLPPSHAEHYRPAPGDDDLVHFWGRRATFEAVLRSYVAELPDVRFEYGTKVEGLLTQRDGTQLRVTGVRLRAGDVAREAHADIVIDAAGGRSNLPGFLEQAGARVEAESAPSGFTYYCRHYRLAEPCDLPRRGTGAVLDYLWFGMFFAEHGHFSIAMACPQEEAALAQAIRRVEGFEAVCAQMPALRQWTDRAQPLTQVLGAGKLENRWIRVRSEDGSPVLGFFPVGDAMMHTNPMYGRGCSAAFVQAHALADALRGASDPAARARRYEAAARRLLRPYYDFAVAADRLFQARARLTRGERVPLPDRLLNGFYESIWNPAVLEDELVGREVVRAMEMREASPIATRLHVLIRVFWLFFARPFRRKRVLLPDLGPPRTEVLRALPAAGEREPTTG